VVAGLGRLPVAPRVDQRDVNIASFSQRGKISSRKYRLRNKYHVAGNISDSSRCSSMWRRRRSRMALDGSAGVEEEARRGRAGSGLGQVWLRLGTTLAMRGGRAGPAARSGHRLRCCSHAWGISQRQVLLVLPIFNKCISQQMTIFFLAIVFSRFTCTFYINYLYFSSSSARTCLQMTR
jgi:hypothetical protein